MLRNFSTSRKPERSTAQKLIFWRRSARNKQSSPSVDDAKGPRNEDKAGAFFHGDNSKVFREGLRTITQDAYAWNCATKRDVLEYDLVPFVFRPQAKWDPKEMEAFERAGVTINPDEEIVSSVSLGLKASVALATERLTHVQEKAAVLVEAYFRAPPTPSKA